MRFARVRESAGAARRMVGGCLADSFTATVFDTAVLLVSELVTNAVLYGGPTGAADDLVLRIDAGEDRIRVEVSDGSVEVPIVATGSPETVSGRGMVLVDRMSSRWGVMPSQIGKIVWFELDC